MKQTLGFALGVLGIFASFAPIALADTPAVSIAGLSPSNATVVANDRITFNIVATGFIPQTYQLTDSYRGTSAALSNISGAGNFFWVPIVSDVGSHTFTITVSDNDGHSVNAVQTVTVLPPPSLTISSVRPSAAVMPGTTVTFNLTPTGFTNPRYSVSDSFSGSSAVVASIDSAGLFTWTPDTQQNGEHTIYVYASDSLGHNASAQTAVRVGPGPSLGVILLAPGPTVPLGTTTTFLVTATNFAPSSFTVTDSFPGSTVNNNNISTTGSFIWSPQLSDIGVHNLTIQGMVGFFGATATTSLKLTVTGTAPTPAPAAPAAPTAPAAATAPSAPSSDRYTFNNFMGLGEDPNDGPDVLQLQKRLVALGFLKATPTGYFGPATQTAVKKFQKANKILQTGYVGSLTRAALNK